MNWMKTRTSVLDDDWWIMNDEWQQGLTYVRCTIHDENEESLHREWIRWRYTHQSFPDGENSQQKYCDGSIVVWSCWIRVDRIEFPFQLALHSLEKLGVENYLDVDFSKYFRSLFLATLHWTSRRQPPSVHPWECVLRFLRFSCNANFWNIETSTISAASNTCITYTQIFRENTNPLFSFLSWSWKRRDHQDIGSIRSSNYFLNILSFVSSIQDTEECSVCPSWRANPVSIQF